MKRIWLSLLIAVMIFVSGCANQQTAQSQAAQEQTSGQAASEQERQGGETKEVEPKASSEAAGESEFGAFYGKNANLNKEGMDTIQTQTGIPTVFIEATFEKLPEAYLTLGELLGEEERGKEKKIYRAPSLPYNWVGRPPSVNRVPGMQWLGSLLFPEVPMI